ncbi:hypothetical protein BC829DRAFT_52986 [Chytridium lagenaria]|nr:hypothetical protein BC829DRAFT_52986 [Chytridium lagenaria]
MSAAANAGVAGKRDSVLSRTPSSTMPSSVAGSNTTSIKGATVGLGTGSTMGKGTVGLGIGLGRSTNGTSSADDAASRNRRKSAANVSTIQLSTATLGSFKPMDGSLLESKMKQSQLPQQNPKPDPFEDEFPSLAAGTSQYTKGNRAMKESSKGDSVSAVAPAESRSVDWAAKVTASSSAEARQAAAAERRSDSITQFSDKEELERLRILVPKIQVSSKQGSNKLPRKTNKTISTINPPKPATSNPRLSTSIASNTTSRASSMSIKMSSSPPIAALGAKPQVASMPVHTSLSGLLRPLQRTGKQLGKEKKNDARKSSEEVAEPTLTSPVKQKAEDETKSGRSDSDSSLMVSDGIAKDRKPAIKSAGSDDDSLVSAFENVKIGETPNDKSWPFETDSPFSKAPTPIVRLAESKPPPESWEDEVASPLLTTSSIGTVAPLQKEVPKSPPSAELDIVEDVPSQLEINSARNGLKNDFSDRQPLLPVREEEIPSKSGDSGTEGMGRYSEPHQLLSAGSSQPTLDFSTFQYLSGISPVEDNSHPPYSHPNAFKGRSLSEAFTSKLPPSNQYQRHSVDHYPMDTSYYSEANPAYPDPAPSFVPSVMLETHDILNQRMRTMSSPAISFNKVHASQRSPSATTLGGFWTTEYKPQESMLPSLVSPGHFFPERLELLGRHGSVDERNGEYIMTEEEKSAFWGVSGGVWVVMMTRRQMLCRFSLLTRLVTGRYPTVPRVDICINHSTRTRRFTEGQPLLITPPQWHFLLAILREGLTMAWDIWAYSL